MESKAYYLLYMWDDVHIAQPAFSKWEPRVRIHNRKLGLISDMMSASATKIPSLQLLEFDHQHIYKLSKNWARKALIIKKEKRKKKEKEKVCFLARTRWQVELIPAFVVLSC